MHIQTYIKRRTPFTDQEPKQKVRESEKISPVNDNVNQMIATTKRSMDSEPLRKREKAKRTKTKSVKSPPSVLWTRPRLTREKENQLRTTPKNNIENKNGTRQAHRVIVLIQCRYWAFTVQRVGCHHICSKSLLRRKVATNGAEKAARTKSTSQEWKY